MCIIPTAQTVASILGYNADSYTATKAEQRPILPFYIMSGFPAISVLP